MACTPSGVLPAHHSLHFRVHTRVLATLGLAVAVVSLATMTTPAPRPVETDNAPAATTPTANLIPVAPVTVITLAAECLRVFPRRTSQPSTPAS